MVYKNYSHYQMSGTLKPAFDNTCKICLAQVLLEIQHIFLQKDIYKSVIWIITEYLGTDAIIIIS